MTPALYAVFGVVGTFFFLAIVGGGLYFVVELIRTIRGFRQSLDSATQALQTIAPLLKGEDFTRLSNAMILMGKQGAAMLQKMGDLDKTIGLFYQFAVARNEVDGAVRSSSVAPSPGGGRFTGMTDERAAVMEAAREAQEGTGGV
jgi:type II secretory pathway component PulF